MSEISCLHINKSYPVGFTGRKKKLALQDLCLDVQRGEVFGIVGPNGAGKSTLLKIIMGFIRPEKGEVFIADLPVHQYTCRMNVGFLPENPTLYRHLSLAEHLQFAAHTAGWGRSDTRTKIESLADKVDLLHARNAPIRSFSKGMTQRAALAYALFLGPDILILDEPMSGLDPNGRQLVIDIIKDEHEKGTTVLLCSHILTDVERICTRIGVMNKSRLIRETTPEELHREWNKSSVGMTPLESFFFETIKMDMQ
jgi:ABC-2 type transport system ATP-binding protein